MRITFFGPPGSGKGTQAERISSRFNLEHISTGWMLREEVKGKTELGNSIRTVLEGGRLVDDEIINGEVFSRIKGLNRFLLDGYPRSISQAESLDVFLHNRGIPLSCAVFMTVSDDEAIGRLTSRLTCPQCSFAVRRRKFRVGDSCIKCGAPISERYDDKLEVIALRLHHYHDLTACLEKYYSGRLCIIDGMGAVDEVTIRLEKALKQWE